MPITLDSIARPSGGLAMVAMDQRESLRTMFVDAGRPDVTTAELTEFKCAVAEVLSPEISGFLTDREHGFPQVRDRGLVAPTAGLILAADSLVQEPLGPVTDTGVDAAVLAPDFDRGGVVALKLLVKWKRDGRRQARREMAEQFARSCDRLGLLSVLEPVVEPTERELADGSWDHLSAICECADELSRVGQSLYKVQVPLGGRGPRDVLDAACRELNSHIVGPWVVLSQGVDRDDYLTAVTSACAAGASGFLAGRAIWSDLVGRADLRSALAEISVPRLRRLCEVVDTVATPWHGKEIAR